MSDSLPGAALFRGTNRLNGRKYEKDRIRTDMPTLKVESISEDFPDPLYD